MRKIRIVCVGKLQDSFLKEGIQAYEKKMKRYCSFSWQIVKEANYGQGSKPLWLDSEFSRLSKCVSPRSFSISCDEAGDSLSSLQFADLFKKTANAGYSQIDFFIGGAHGLPDKLTHSTNRKISLSPMTFTHQMVRLILAEQIYRAFTIVNNEKYHHL
jgi:23S rRNA (pseudouridine1915-N3)-methyltransferase